eukprot:363690-Chlamydomonas_euryale.AAC.6
MEIMVVGRPMTLLTFKLSGKELLITGRSMSEDMDVQHVHALAAFHETWACPKLSNQQIMDSKWQSHLSIFLCGFRMWDMDGGSNGQTRGQSFYSCLPHCRREADRSPQAGGYL